MNYENMKSRGGVFTLDSKKVTIILCTFTLFLAQLTENTGLQLWMFGGYAIVLLWSLVCRASNIFGMILFLLSDNSILDIGGISIQLLLMGVYYMRYIMLKRRKIYLYVLILAVTISVYSFSYINLGITYVLQGVKLAVMIIYLTEFLSEKDRINFNFYKDMIDYAVIGIVMSLIVAVLLNPSMLLASRIALSSDSNWNMLGILAALLFSHCFFTYFMTPKIQYIIYCFLTALCALISTSRTAILVISLSIIWCIVATQSAKKNFLRKLIILACISLFIVFIFNGVIRIPFVEQLVDRIIHPRQGDMSNGRFDLWYGYINVLKNNMKILWIGNGSPLVEGVTTLTSKASNVAHNLYLEQLVMYGILGNIIVIGLYAVSYIRIKKSVMSYQVNRRWKKIYILNVVMIFIIGLFSHLLTSVLVTTELYLGYIQYIVFSTDEITRK